MLSRTQAGPGRAIKLEQEENSPNHVQAISGVSVYARTKIDVHARFETLMCSQGRGECEKNPIHGEVRGQQRSFGLKLFLDLFLNF